MTELVVYAASALISFALLGNLLKKLDPNAQNSKQARKNYSSVNAQDVRVGLSVYSSGKSPQNHIVSPLPRPKRNARRSLRALGGPCWSATNMRTCVTCLRRRSGSVCRTSCLLSAALLPVTAAEA